MKKIVCMLVAVTTVLGLFVGCDGTSEKQFTAHDLAIALQANGIKIENIISYTEDTDNNHLLGRPNQYTSKVNFADARAEQPEDKSDPVGGTIEVFKSAKDAKSRDDYIESVTKDFPLLQQYRYLHDNVLLRIDYALTPDQAKEYDDTLIEIIKDRLYETDIIIEMLAKKQLEIVGRFLDDKITIIDAYKESRFILKTLAEIEKNTPSINLNQYSSLSDTLGRCNAKLALLYFSVTSNEKGEILSEKEVEEKIKQNNASMKTEMQGYANEIEKLLVNK